MTQSPRIFYYTVTLFPSCFKMINITVSQYISLSTYTLHLPLLQTKNHVRKKYYSTWLKLCDHVLWMKLSFIKNVHNYNHVICHRVHTWCIMFDDMRKKLFSCVSCLMMCALVVASGGSYFSPHFFIYSSYVFSSVFSLIAATSLLCDWLSVTSYNNKYLTSLIFFTKCMLIVRSQSKK